jgi:hypothetical protein
MTLVIVWLFPCTLLCAPDEATLLKFAGKPENVEVFKRLLPFQFSRMPKGENLVALQTSLEEIPNWDNIVWARLVELAKAAELSKEDHDKLHGVIFAARVADVDVGSNMAARQRLGEIAEIRMKLDPLLKALAMSKMNKGIRLVGPFLESPDLGWDYGDSPLGTTASNALLALLEAHYTGFPLP